MRATLPLLLLFACGPKPPPAAPYTAEDLDAPPQLPAPRAGSYARVTGSPKDPVVASVLGDRTWDVSLAGAAAGLALAAAEGRGSLTRRDLREASWQAGYPWPILAVASWPTSEGGRPPTDVASWIQGQPPERDVGVVRARGTGKDVWVALAARPLIDLGVVPKQMARGQVVRLPQRPGARYRISDGLGQLTEGDLDRSMDLTLSTPGEWLVQVYDEGGDLARFPLYVERESPRVPVLPAGGPSVANGVQAQERAYQLFKAARAHYETPAPTTDPLLQAAAARALGDAGEDPAAYARSLAGAQEVALGARVSGSDVEDCLDRLLYDPRYRGAFVAPAAMGAAFAARLDGARVEMVAIFVGQRP